MPGIRIVPILLMASLALPQAAAAKAAPVQSRWQGSPLRIDGDIGDWQAPFFQGENAVQVEYAFGNDAASLYLVFVFKERKFISSLAQTGLTLWFNDQGKKKKKLGVRLEKRMLGAADVIAVMEKQEGPLSEARRNEILAKPAYLVNQFLAVDGDGHDVSPQVFPRPPLPEFFALESSGRLAFEIRIPMGPDNGLGLAPGRTVLAGFEWGGFTKEMRRELMRRGGYEGSDSGGPPESPDLDPEGVGERESGELPSLRGPKHYLFWCELTLAAGGN